MWEQLRPFQYLDYLNAGRKERYPQYHSCQARLCQHRTPKTIYSFESQKHSRDKSPLPKT